MAGTHFASLILALLLALVTLIDLRTTRIPDPLNALIISCGLAVAWWLGKPLVDALIGVVLGYGALFVANAGYRALRGRDGLGMGDAKLLAGAGAWLGWMGLPFVVVIGSAVGIMYVAALRVGGLELKGGDALAFGPFLSAGFLIVWLVQTYS